MRFLGHVLMGLGVHPEQMKGKLERTSRISRKLQRRLKRPLCIFPKLSERSERTWDITGEQLRGRVSEKPREFELLDQAI